LSSEDKRTKKKSACYTHAGASNKSRKLVIMSNCRVAVGPH